MISILCGPDIYFLKTPIGYHYANHPTKSVDRIREVVFDNFDISTWNSVILVITCQLILLTSCCWITWERRSSGYGFSTFIPYPWTLSRLEMKETVMSQLTYILSSSVHDPTSYPFAIHA